MKITCREIAFHCHSSWSANFVFKPLNISFWTNSFLFPQEFARHSPIHHHENTFYARRIIDQTIPTISLSTNIFSSRSCFYKRRILFYGTFKFQSLSLNQKTPRCRDASAGVRVDTVDASSSAERVSIVNTDAILEGGFMV